MGATILYAVALVFLVFFLGFELRYRITISFVHLTNEIYMSGLEKWNCIGAFVKKVIDKYLMNRSYKRIRREFILKETKPK